MPQMVIPDFMPQIVWLCIVFPLLYLSMKYIALPRITEIISTREEKIRNDINKAEEIRNKIELANNELQSLVNEANNQIKGIVKQIESDSQKEAEKKLEKAQKELNLKFDKKKSDIEKDIKLFQKNIDSIANEATEKILKKILYKTNDPSIIKHEIAKEKERLLHD